MAMGRAIDAQAAGVLFDEPLSNLDAKLRADAYRDQALHQRLKVTSIYVTHDQIRR